MDDTMPPRPESEFDFNLPHGIGAEGTRRSDGDHDAAGHASNIPNQASNSSMEEAPIPHHDLDALFVGDLDNAQQPMNYEMFPCGFSDDEGGEEAFVRSWAVQQARKTSPKNKKSPRRSENSDGSDEAIPRTKRPRKSLFGGPVEEVDDHESESHINDQNPDIDSPEELRPDIRHRMSSLNLDQQEVEDAQEIQDAQDTRPSDLGFCLASFGQGDMSPVPSRAPSEESVIIPPDHQPVYELRKNIDRAKACTYVDTDKTGNYDPSQEARLKALRLQRAKAAKAAKKKGKGKEKVRKEHIPKLILKLRFSAFGNVRNYTNDEDNWPPGWSDVDSDDEEEAKDYRNYYRRNTPNIDMQDGIEDPRGLVDDLTGHPSARGCKQCCMDDKECSMVEGGTFPCEECEEDDVICELIRISTTKGSCRQCVEDGQEICSFEDNPEQVICDECTEGDFSCDPLPPRNYTTPRNSYDKIMYGPNRKHIQCTFCRVEKKRCSLKKETDKPPCKHCKKEGIGCTFYDVPMAVTERKVAAAKKRAALGPTQGNAPEVSKPGSEYFSPEDLADMMRADEEVISREATPEIEMEDEAGNKGMLTKIRTSFAHPIHFNVSVENTNDCNFCEMPMFGFIGHFEKEVHVIRWHNELGYTEVGGGYCEERGPTTMCADCTNTRLQVICCPNHEFEALHDQADVLDFNVIGDELISADALSGDVRYQLQRWCSMCFSVATWGCATVQASLTGEDGENTVGCGLRLCDKCMETLRDEYLWDLEEMAGAMVRMPKTSEDDAAAGALQGKPRVDVDFLRTGGLLMRIMGASSGNAPADEDLKAMQ